MRAPEGSTGRHALDSLLVDSGCVLVLPEPRMVWDAVRPDEEWDVVPYLARVRAGRMETSHGVAAMSGRVGTTPARVRAYCARLVRSYADPSVWRRPVPGAEEFLGAARDSGLRVAVLSNTAAPMARAVLAAAGVCHDSDVGGRGVRVERILDSSETGFVKPARAAYEHALGVLDAEAHGTVMVGDSVPEDVEGASDAGVLGIHYDPLRLCRLDHPHVHALGAVAVPTLVSVHQQNEGNRCTHE